MPQSTPAGPESSSLKTVIGVLASRDSRSPSATLAALFRYYSQSKNRTVLEKFHFVFTGGTYDRLFLGDRDLGLPALEDDVAEWLRGRCGVTRLPPGTEGGVTILACLITQRLLGITWPFFSASEDHWLRPENLSFMRLCDQWRVKRLMSRGSVMVWVDYEAGEDARRNLRALPLTISFEDEPTQEENTRHGRCQEPILLGSSSTSDDRVPFRGSGAEPLAWIAESKPLDEMSIALIAHDEMKARMIEFAIDHDSELKKFARIVSTQTTGREVAAATSRSIDRRIARRHSGPKGGDIEIATEVLCNRCDIVIFFVDPLRPHPHIDDIRVVFQSCMLKDQVVMITNEMHAREFMSRVIRGRDTLTFYPSRL